MKAAVLNLVKKRIHYQGQHLLLKHTIKIIKGMKIYLLLTILRQNYNKKVRKQC